MKTIIEFDNKYYLAEPVPSDCKDKCLNCPLNSQCADEDNTNLCEEYGLKNFIHITKEINNNLSMDVEEFKKRLEALIHGHIYLNYKDVDIQPIDDIELNIITKKIIENYEKYIKS